MTMAEILSKFQNVRKTTSGWQALCPSHDDNNPSLSISASGQKILLHCFADCETADILAAAGLSWTDLHLDDEQRPKIVAKYNYCDEFGKLLYQNVRYHPKAFKVRRPGLGGWIWNLDGVRRVPYRLPELLASEWCFVVEGERDVKTAEKMKLTATCNPFGAGKWVAEYSEHFRGKHVFIIPDNDDPGERH